MKKINKSRYAVLGMIFDKPRSGYEIMQMMDESTAHFWQESDASIYPMLKLLEAEGRVMSKSEFVGKRERRIFEITQAGKDEFLAWMALPAEPGTRRSELLLKVFFGGCTTKDEVIKQLNLRLGLCLKEKEKYRLIQADVFPTIPDTHSHKIYWEMALRNGVLSVEADIKWIKECLAKLGNN